MTENTQVLVLGDILHLLGDPASADTNDPTRQPSDNPAVEYVPDGALLINDGHVTSVGSAQALLASTPEPYALHDYRGQLIVPGFIDTHVHYPQCEVIASYGTQLLDWLNTYTFPAEQRFNDPIHAATIARFFLDELIRHGTTTALVFGTSDPTSVDAFFTEAQRQNLRMICGKVMMDRNAPESLCDTAESSYADSKSLIQRWHQKDRLGYAVTPRFAPTSTNRQLSLAGQLLQEHPSVHLHTHLAENTDEIAWVQSLFPDRRSYLDVYDHFGLLGSRSVFAHSIYLDDNDWRRLSDSGSAIAHCPTSNLFIGSGLFDLQAASRWRIKTGLGTDVGGGDSFSLLRTINEAYKIQQLQSHRLAPMSALYMATLGGAIALDMQRHIGNFEQGKEADFIVLNPSATPLMTLRQASCKTLEETLFMLMMLGDDRAITDTFILGESRKKRLAVAQ